jgi:hypothetical protein
LNPPVVLFSFSLVLRTFPLSSPLLCDGTQNITDLINEENRDEISEEDRREENGVELVMKREWKNEIERDQKGSFERIIRIPQQGNVRRARGRMKKEEKERGRKKVELKRVTEMMENVARMDSNHHF